MKLIVGLGNPGPEYENSRHNTGYMTVARVAATLQTAISRQQFNALTGTVNYQNEKVILMQPLTYMNESGRAVKAAVDYYKLPVDDIIIIYDDMDLKCGQIRLRQAGSSAGHNGINSIIACLNTDVFNRIRIGVEHNRLLETPDYVLSGYTAEQRPAMIEAQTRAAQAAIEAISHPFKEVMEKYNQNRGEG